MGWNQRFEGPPVWWGGWGGVFHVPSRLKQNLEIYLAWSSRENFEILKTVFNDFTVGKCIADLTKWTRNPQKSASRRAFFFFWLLPVLRLTGTSSTNGSSSTIVYSVKMVDYWRGKNFSVNLKGRKKHYREVSCPSQIGAPSMVGGGGCFPCPISLEDLVSRLKDPVWSMTFIPLAPQAPSQALRWYLITFFFQ